MSIIDISDGLKIGNLFHMKFLCVDSDGKPITNLADTTEIYFMIKEKSVDADNAAIISKNKTSGAITIDSPTPGYITFFINSPDWSAASPATTATKGDKPIALQLNYSTDNHQEVYLKENITDTEFITSVKLLQDTIRG